MKLLLHDFTGHAFTAQLGRALAWRNLDVVYASFFGFATPKGRVAAVAGDPDRFRAVQIGISAAFDKNNLFRRRHQQLEYARRVGDLVLAERPDVVLSANSPIEVQEQLASACRLVGASFAYWVQDIHSEAIERIVGRRSGLLGRLAGAYYRRKEARVLRNSDLVVLIAEAFRDVLAQPRWHLDVADMVVIENWANLGEMPVMSPDNQWARRNMRAGRQRLVYSGTLARKHDPDVLLNLARSLDADLYLFSEGTAPDYVRQRAAAETLDNVFVRPWVGVDDLPSMLAGADILLAIMEADAGVFSVPSKVLSYLAAGRPILASIPQSNLAAATIRRAGAGLVVEPGDTAQLIEQARALLDGSELRAAMGQAGRAYAEATFDIEAISAHFERLLCGCVRARRDTSPLIARSVNGAPIGEGQ